jgi:hypothetical protein
MKIKIQVLGCFLGLLAFTNVVLAQQSETSKAAVIGQISEWIAQLNDSDYAKRNAAVVGLASQADDALPLLQQQLKAETGNRRWWLSVAIQQCEEKRTRPGEISANPTNAKGLLVGEACKDGDGLFAVVERDGVPCWQVPRKGNYLYFSASDEFRKKKTTALEIQVEYLDAGTGEISLDYDSTNLKAAINGAYENHSKYIHCTNSGQWRKTRFHLPNARFRGSENGQTDFRFNNGGDDMIIRAVGVWPSRAND